MKTIKTGALLAITISLLVGVSSAGFLDQETKLPSWATIGDTGHYSPLISGDGWFGPGYVPRNISDWLYPEPTPAVPEPEDPFAAWQPVPMNMPNPLPLSKADLFGSLPTVSKNKQSLISSMKGGYYPG